MFPFRHIICSQNEHAQFQRSFPPSKPFLSTVFPISINGNFNPSSCSGQKPWILPWFLPPSHKPHIQSISKFCQLYFQNISRIQPLIQPLVITSTATTLAQTITQITGASPSAFGALKLHWSMSAVLQTWQACPCPETLHLLFLLLRKPLCTDACTAHSLASFRSYSDGTPQWALPWPFSSAVLPPCPPTAYFPILALLSLITTWYYKYFCYLCVNCLPL